MSKKTTTKISIVYIGKLGTIPDTRECFFITDNESIGKEITFKPSKTIKGYAIGHVYEIEHNDSTYSFGTTVWQKQFGDREKVAGWQAAYQADRITRQTKAHEKKHATNDSALMQSIKELQQVYQSLSHQQRPGFEAWLLTKLRSRIITS